MVRLPLTDSQVAWLIRQMSPENQAAVLVELFRTCDSALVGEAAEQREEIWEWFEQRGLNYFELSEEERVARYMAHETLRELERITDPEVMLNEALRELKENQIKRRE